MLIEDFNALAPQLEPGASAGCEGVEPFVISLAISAKRIADAMTKLAGAFDPTVGPSGANFVDALSGVLSDRLSDLGRILAR